WQTPPSWRRRSPSSTTATSGSSSSWPCGGPAATSPVGPGCGTRWRGCWRPSSSAAGTRATAATCRLMTGSRRLRPWPRCARSCASTPRRSPSSRSEPTTP
ncbi:MAG: hypothetical protein AVDCRST_MAG76-1342, partial [uncultured Acidimicrobiales bacterium]